MQLHTALQTPGVLSSFAQPRKPSHRQCRRCQTRAVQSSKKPSRPVDCEQDRYPYEEASPDEGFFPRREPGKFPSVRVMGFWDKAKGKLGFIPSDAEEDLLAPGFDPLRDGPLRYLGYSNECG